MGKGKEKRMSLILKGIDMPRNCFECKFGMYDYSGLAQDLAERKKLHKFECVITGKSVTSTKRNRFCPLIQIPKGHGRLIDADELKAKREWMRWRENNSTHEAEFVNSKYIDNAPTILEAEE